MGPVRRLRLDWRSAAPSTGRSVVAVAHNYTYRVEWHSRTAQYVARCLEMPTVWESADTAAEATARVEHTVAAHLAGMAEVFGDDPPEPLTDHEFSGKMLIRTSAELHRRMTIEAAEQGVSLNQWVVQKLADRPPALDW